MSDPTDRLRSVRRAAVDAIAVLRTARASLDSSRGTVALAAYPEVAAALDDERGVREKIEGDLSVALQDLGPVDVDQAVARSLGLLTDRSAGLASQMPSWPVSRVVKEQVLVLSSMALAITTLHALSLARGVETLAETTRNQLETVAAATQRFNELLPAVTVQEASAREPVASQPDAKGRAVRQTRLAWKRAHRATA